MILTKQVENEAILSNVGATTDFRIKATAKSFRILADGLYSNKHRAIVRELSCNAYDSHVAAGKVETPFDVHLPNALEPWFSIRDYGVGLTAEEVTNIFTTFFESTKTESNDYVGALGLGSKSPFSYTDNFTITAIKHGIKGVYTAFINDFGVPSIALMASEETTDPTGVEIRFAVEQNNDFYTFLNEAQHVYRTFKHRPVVSGNSRFSFKEFDFETRDIIPGVHSVNNGYACSFAIMGNIAYPIDIPDSNSQLGALSALLGCNLVMEFQIGELDFQASREALSYIPSTIEAIKKKLEALNDKLAEHVADEANAIANEWDRAAYLVKKSKSKLWKSAVLKYMADTKFDLVSVGGYYLELSKVKLLASDISTKFNIDIRSFYTSHGKAIEVNPFSVQVGTEYKHQWKFEVSSENTRFVVNDTKVGPFERAKYHFKVKGTHNNYVFVLSPSDKKVPMNVAGFLKEIHNPPSATVFNASALLEKPRKVSNASGISILELTERGYGSYYSQLVWRESEKLDYFCDTDTYYYLPLSGFTSLGKVNDVNELIVQMDHANIAVDKVYGVRKTDIEAVSKMKNWVNLDTYVMSKLNSINVDYKMGLVKHVIPFNTLYHPSSILTQVDSTSPYLELYNEFSNIVAINRTFVDALKWLCSKYDVVMPNTNVDVSATIDTYNNKVAALYKRYPLLEYIQGGRVPSSRVAEYINMIDKL